MSLGLRVGTFHLQKVDSEPGNSVPVEERFRSRTIWKGIVEVFNLIRHPNAKRCYAWSHPEGEDNKGERFVTVLEIPPVDSPQTAVKISIANDVKNLKK
jgi:hypothetical protein